MSPDLTRHGSPASNRARTAAEFGTLLTAFFVCAGLYSISEPVGGAVGAPLFFVFSWYLWRRARDIADLQGWLVGLVLGRRIGIGWSQLARPIYKYMGLTFLIMAPVLLFAGALAQLV